MNEGHAALLILELGFEEMQRRGLSEATREVALAVKPLCVFTTHTPVPAGHDQFPLTLLREVLTDYHGAYNKRAVEFCLDGILNMTYLALDNSHFVNGVAKKHGETSRHMFGQYKIDSITNGVHAAFWIAPPIRAVLDRHIGAWREDNASLRYALGIPRHELWAAHQTAKQDLVAWRESAHRREPVFEHFHDRLRTPRDDVEARRPAVPRHRSPARAACERRADPDRLRRQGAPARRCRQGTDPNNLRPDRTPQRQAQRRLRRGLRHGGGRAPGRPAWTCG